MPNMGSKSINIKQTFQTNFTKSENIHQHNTRHATQNSVALAQQNTDLYGIKPVQHQSILIWNQLQTEISHDVLQIQRSKLKEQITNKIFDSY